MSNLPILYLVLCCYIIRITIRKKAPRHTLLQNLRLLFYISEDLHISSPISLGGSKLIPLGADVLGLMSSLAPSFASAQYLQL